MRPDIRVQGGFVEKQIELENAGLWKLAEVTEATQTMPKGLPETTMQVWVFEVTG